MINFNKKGYLRRPQEYFVKEGFLNSNNEMLRWIIWRCSNKHEVKEKKSCANKNIDNRVLYQIFDDVFNVLVENKGK